MQEDRNINQEVKRTTDEMAHDLKHPDSEFEISAELYSDDVIHEAITEIEEELDSCDMLSTAEIACRYENMRKLKQKAFYGLSLIFLTAAVIVFSLLIEMFPLYAKILCVVGAVVFCGFCFFFLFSRKQKLLKLFFVLLICWAVFTVCFFILEYNGLIKLLTDGELLKDKIDEHGVFAIPIFIVLQFLQSTILPIPSSITTFVGAKLFGGFLGSVYSLIGIIPASILAFVIGRYAGYRLVLWIVGKESLIKTLNMVKGRDKVVITLMFLLPFFPDDILCFIAGFSTMSIFYFVIMLSVSRAIQVFTTSFFLGEGLIPFNNWWGILIWVVLALLVIWLFFICIKKGDKIEKFFITKILKKEYNENSGYIDKLLHLIDKYDDEKKEKQIEKMKKQYRKRLNKQKELQKNIN